MYFFSLEYIERVEYHCITKKIVKDAMYLRYIKYMSEILMPRRIHCACFVAAE